MINGPTKFECVNNNEKKDLSLKKSESDAELINALNAHNANEDIVVQSMNEMRLSTELAKSEILSKEFVNDSNEEDCCKNIVQSMERNQKVNLEKNINTEEKVNTKKIENSSKKTTPIIKPENEQI